MKTLLKTVMSKVPLKMSASFWGSKVAFSLPCREITDHTQVVVNVFHFIRWFAALPVYHLK